MKRVIAKVDMLVKTPEARKRYRAFNRLCLLLMLLRVMSEVELQHLTDPSHKLTWHVDWEHAEEKVKNMPKC